MKFDLRGIRFNVWLYFLGFAFLVLALFGIFQAVLIRPYYRSDRIAAIESLANTIKTDIFDQHYVSENNIEHSLQAILNNNACVVILDHQGQRVYENDSLGDLCLLDKSIVIDEKSYDLKNDLSSLNVFLLEEGEFYDTVVSPVNDTDMLIYGQKIKDDLGDYYLYINSPLEPVESVIDFIFSQFIYIAVAVLVLAMLLSYFLTKRMTGPILKIKKGAEELADGNYSASFKVDSYSEINELAHSLSDAQSKLSKVDELRRDLIANVSHDIKTPLTMIKAYSEMIKDISGDDPQKRNEHLDVIMSETDYLNKLVDDMRELSMMQAGYVILNRTNFDIKDAVNDIVNLLSAMIKENHLTIIKDIESCVIWADEVKMKQVISNFLNNAVKYSKENGIITIKTINTEDSLRLEVIDEGEGIPKDKLPYIWDRYYKIDKSFTRNITSTGLGLAIAKAILEAHHAKYGAISTLGKGTTFYFEISKDYEEEDEGLS